MTYIDMNRRRMLTWTVLLLTACCCCQANQQTFFETKDTGHIREDIKDHYYVDVDEKANEEEMDFLNFKHYDLDNNYVLDGLELLMELNHHADEKELKWMSSAQKQQYWLNKFDTDSAVIDVIISQYDTNDDGYISFSEYIQAKAVNSVETK